MVASIIGEVDRLTEITETYLRFTRLPRPKLEREDLGALVALGAWRWARGEIAQEGITLEVDIAPRLPELPADEAQLRQALINLVRNAREALASAPTKRLRDLGARQRPRRSALSAWCRVSDIGRRDRPGMTSARSSIRSSRPRRRGRGWGWRWCSRSSSTMAGGSTSRACPGGGPPSRWRFRSERQAGRELGPSAAGGVAVGGGAAALPEGVVEGGERQVQGGRIGRLEDERVLEGGGGGGALTGRGQGAA